VVARLFGEPENAENREKQGGDNLNLTLANLYEEWFQKTGDPNAAATLVLAQVQAGDHEPQGDEKDTYSPADIAKRLHVSPATVRHWITTRQLKASNLASGQRPRYIIQPDALEAFLKMRQPEPPVRRSKRNLAA
jgi:hypothetical protein